MNFPPIHPNCRCVTISDTASVRIARDPLDGHTYNVDGSVTFEQWKNGLTQEQREAMEGHVKEMRNTAADVKQYERYKSVLGAENVPKTLDKFIDVKYNDGEKYAELKQLYRDRKIQNKIRNEYNLIIHEGKQGKHIVGHNNYKTGRSYMTISSQEMQDLIYRYAGTGRINRDRKGRWCNTETIEHDAIIGVDIDNRTGKTTETNIFKIHYAKNGTHIVPKRE